MDKQNEILLYKIRNYSSFSSVFRPENILVDKPGDQSSRWSSENNHTPQFLLLELEKPGIVKTIKFGKYDKYHVCNLKRLKIYSGLVMEDMTEIFDGGLKNDSTPEVFKLPHEKDGKYLPSKFLKIVPLQSWGASFNFSIWFIELRGILDSSLVNPIVNWYQKKREQQATLLCLKHFRQLNYMEAYEALLRESNVTLEHSLLTELHREIVMNGNYLQAEEILQKAAREGLFEDFASQQNYVAKWQSIESVTREVNPSRPGMRGGHQMCIDSASGIIYLFGGWDGLSDLGDFWLYHIQANEWQLVTPNTANQGGPSPRSCHKMCFDEERKHLFVLGRYLDNAKRTADNLKCDFYMYEVNSEKWTMITEDTAGMGGPGLIFDHQMVIDSEKNTLYIFGGRLMADSTVHLHVSEDRVEATFSGLFSYHVPTNTWCKIKDDCEELKARVGHSMIFHPFQRNLYIVAGQRAREHFNDFFAYNVDAHKIKKIVSNTPAAGFTHRATLDLDANEIYVLSGYGKEQARENVSNSFWVYDINRNKWACVFNNEEEDGSKAEKNKKMPVPRFAHQLVYDHVQKTHYLFGGNPGREMSQKMRLDDFWSLKLCKPLSSELLRQCLLLVRTHQYKELTVSDSVRALKFLQTELAAVIDHKRPEEREQFHNLASKLFSSSDEEEDMDQDCPNYSPQFQARTRLYTQLLELFPSHMTQPKENLTDLVKLWP